MAVPDHRRSVLFCAAAITAAVLAGGAACAGEPRITVTELPAPPVASSQPGTPPVNAVGFPHDPHGYADAALVAWVNHRSLDELAAPDARAKLNAIADWASRDWTYNECVIGDVVLFCTFVDVDGNSLRFDLDGSRLGKTHAVAQATLELTQYPPEAKEYVYAFLDAWTRRNRARMRALSDPKIEYMMGPPTFTPLQTATTGAGRVSGDTYVYLTNKEGRSMTFRLTNPRLGRPHAIVCVTFGDAC